MKCMIFGFLVLWVVLQIILAQGQQDPDIIVDTKPVPIVGEETPTTPSIDVTKTQTVDGNVEAEPVSVLSEAEFKQWPMKRLKEFLSLRDLSCKGCSEKEDYIKMAVENQHVPVVEKKEAPEASPKPEPNREEIDEMMAKLRRGGFGGSKFFTADDLQGLTPEEVAEKINGKGAGKKSKKSKDKKSSKKTTSSESGDKSSSNDEESTADEKADKGKKQEKESSTKKESSKKSKSDNKGKKESKDSKKSQKKSDDKSKKSDKSFHSDSGKAHSKRQENPLEEETIEL